MVRRLHMIILIFILCFLCGCGKKEEKENEENNKGQSLTTSNNYTNEAAEKEEIKTNAGNPQNNTSADSEEESEDKEEESVSSDDIMYGTELDALPDVMEPLDNDYKCNPRITNLDLMRPVDFDRDKLLDAILTYMYYQGIQDDTLEEIEVNEFGTQGTDGYRMTLKFKKNENREIVVFYYNNTYYHIQPYIDDEDIGFVID